MAENHSNNTQTKNGLDLSWAFDFAKLLGPYSLVGVDYSKILESERKNIAALAEANKIAFEGWQALIRKQSEMFQEIMEQTIANAGKQDIAKSRAELAKQGFERALNEMREIAATTAKYQHDAFDVVHKRFGEHMRELQSLQKPGMSPELEA